MDIPNALTGFYFELLFKQEKIAFQEISGLATEQSVEEIAETGENRFKYKLPTMAKYQNLILKRGLVPKDSAFIAWCKRSLSGGLETPITPNSISISLLDAKQHVQMKWNFYNAFPVKFSIDDLKSQESMVLVDTIELAYNYFQVLTDK